VIRKITSFALHQPLFLVMLLVLFVAAGVAAFQSIPVEAFPDVTDVQVTFISLFPGHAPEEVEKQVTIPVEAFPDVTDVQVTVISLFPGHAPGKWRSRSPFQSKSGWRAFRTRCACSRTRSSGCPM